MEYCIYSGKYETGNAAEQQGFSQLFGEDGIQSKFDLYFHWFNVIHELGHSLVDFNGVQMNAVEEELFVNCFAVQYWKNVDDRGNLEKVKQLNSEVLSKMPSFVPTDTDFLTFFSDIWASDQMNSTEMYGYFQMLCVQKAFDSTECLKDLLEKIGYEQVDTSSLASYEDEINAENAVNVVRTCLDNLKLMGCSVPEIKVELVDNPEIQCCQNA